MSSLEIVAVGSAVVDRTYALTNLPEPDGGAFVRERSDGVGGVAANVASALATLGRETGIVTRLGEREAADIEAALQESSLDTRRVRTGPEESSYSMILRGPDGDRMVLAGGESVPNLRLDDADIEYASGANAVFTSAYAPDAVVSDLVRARERGSVSMLAFDLAGPLAELEGRATTPETVERLLPVVDLFVVGEVAARSFLGTEAREAVAALERRGVRRAAVTRGEAGALLLENGDESETETENGDGNGGESGEGDGSGATGTRDGSVVTDVPAFEVSVADTTGAGDAFTAGLIDAWLLRGESAATAGRFAAAGAALNCTAEGARGGVPTRDEVRAFAGERR